MSELQQYVRRGVIALRQTLQKIKITLSDDACFAAVRAVVDVFPNLRWYMATTKPNGEMLAARELRNQGYTVYVPKTFEQQTEGRRVEPVALLRLRGYIIVAFDINKEEHGPINNTRGVGELLLDGQGEPEPLWPRLVEKLRQLEDEDFEAARSSAEIKERPDLREWDEVIVDAHDHRCFGERGYFMEASKKGVAKVLIGLKKWEVNIFDLRKVEKPKKESKLKKSKKKSQKAKLDQPERKAA